MTNGELPDWDRIVERHAQCVFRVALRILKSVQDAEDVSQDVFIEARRNWSILSRQIEAALRQSLIRSISGAES